MTNAKRAESPKSVKDSGSIEGAENIKGMESKGNTEKAKQAKRKGSTEKTKQAKRKESTGSKGNVESAKAKSTDGDHVANAQAPVRRLIHCEELGIDAYELQGYVRPFPAHVHEYYVVGLVLQGSRALRVCGKDYSLDKGSMLLLNPGESHSCLQLSEEPLSYRAIVVPPLTLEQYKHRTSRGSAPVVFDRCVIRDKASELLFMQASEALLQEYPWEEADKLLSAFFNHLLLVLLDLAEMGDIQQGESEAVNQVNRKMTNQSGGRVAKRCEAEAAEQQMIRVLCAYVEDHFHEPFHIDELCRVGNMSQSTLLRLFAKTLGITPYKYVESVRVEHARAMLIQNEAPSKVAYQCGFANQSHFTKVFSSLTGLTPAAFQQMYRAKHRVNAKGRRGFDS